MPTKEELERIRLMRMRTANALVPSKPSQAPAVIGKPVASHRQAVASRKVADMLSTANLNRAISSGRAMVGFLLDKSGSMAMVKPQTIEGFNDFVAALRKYDGIAMSFWQFDTESFERIYEALPITTVPNLTPEKYVPGGGTPLIDSITRTIRRMEEMVRGQANQKVVIVIQTDGQDTSGGSWDELRSLIQTKERQGWQFMFLGAGVDAYLLGRSMGINPLSTMSYGLDRLTTKAAFTASANAAIKFITDQSPTAAYTANDRRLAGDKHTPPRLTFDKK